MNFLNLLVSPVTEILKSSAPPLKRHIFYLVHYKKNVEELGRKVEDLKNARTDVQYRVDAARRKQESVRQVVEAWLEKVNVETTRYEILVGLMNGGADIEMMDHQYRKSWSRYQTRYNIGREAKKKMVIVNELLNEGKSFSDVSDASPSPLDEAYCMSPRGNHEVYVSRESIKNQVLATLKDKTNYLIGVYGMAGVGKTTLMNQVVKQMTEEKFFDHIVMTTVSQNIDVKRIQDQIARKFRFIEYLNEVDDKPTRVAMLYAGMKREKKFLVILDDLWSNLDLNDVGIPYGDPSGATIFKYEITSWKVVIVSRSLEVCNSMCTQKNIEVGVLPEKDSWNLFKNNAGDGTVDSPNLQLVAREVANECGGLPIALVTLGRALRNKENKLVWDDTLLQLKRSNFTYIEGMSSKVFSSIRLSYDHLQNEIIKKCFLLCCLYPEDFTISTDLMMMHIMADESILEDLETLKQARGRLNTVLDKLMASCLLLGSKKNDGEVSYVLMHDVIRDVAISIASDDENGFFIKAGVGLRNWPENGRLLLSSGKCLRLSLMRNEISVLPDQPEFPHLLSMSLEGNKPLNKIPGSFFQSMKSLKTLDLSSTSISVLPSSISCLVNLCTLYLDNCAFDQLEDLSLIGNLKKLKILSLQNCNLQRLSEEIRGLTSLKLLNLSDNENLTIVPPNVISSLTRLEELHMNKSFKEWELEMGSGRNASLAEVASLPCLTTLHLILDKIPNLNGREFEQCVKFDVTLGSENREKCLNFDPKKNHFSCHLTAPPPICHSIKLFLERVDSLEVRLCFDLKSLEQLVTGNGFYNMKSLFVVDCYEMEYLISVVEENIPRNAFINLEYLFIHSMDNLKEILRGPTPVGFINKLKLLHVKQCSKIVIIFTSDLVKRALNLEELRIESCHSLKNVFYLEEGSIDEKESVATFSKLRKMYLKNLDFLQTIWKGFIPLGCLENLKVMNIYRCLRLRYLFSPAMARSLQQLEELSVSDCWELVNLVTTSTDNTAAATPSQIILPNLKILLVQACNNLKRLFPLMDLDGGGLSQLERLEVWACKSMEKF